MRMPKFITDCCAQVRADRLPISPSMARSKCSCSFPGSSERQHRQTYSPMPIAEAYCARMVAAAAPPMPQPKTATNSKSSPMFSSADTARNTSGTVELPKARSRQAQKW